MSLLFAVVHCLSLLRYCQPGLKLSFRNTEEEYEQGENNPNPNNGEKTQDSRREGEERRHCYGSQRKDELIPVLFQCGPYRLVLLFVPEMNTGRRYQNTFLTATWILEIASYINSSFNIFIYYSMGSRYRETMKALFCRGRIVAKLKTTDTEQITTVTVSASTVL